MGKKHCYIRLFAKVRGKFSLVDREYRLVERTPPRVSGAGYFNPALSQNRT